MVPMLSGRRGAASRQVMMLLVWDAFAMNSFGHIHHLITESR
jgi:hypothetical protein